MSVGHRLDLCVDVRGAIFEQIELGDLLPQGVLCLALQSLRKPVGRLRARQTRSMLRGAEQVQQLLGSTRIEFEQ